MASETYTEHIYIYGLKQSRHHLCKFIYKWANQYKKQWTLHQHTEWTSTMTWTSPLIGIVHVVDLSDRDDFMNVFQTLLLQNETWKVWQSPKRWVCWVQTNPLSHTVTGEDQLRLSYRCPDLQYVDGNTKGLNQLMRWISDQSAVDSISSLSSMVPGGD